MRARTRASRSVDIRADSLADGTISELLRWVRTRKEGSPMDKRELSLFLLGLVTACGSGGGAASAPGSVGQMDAGDGQHTQGPPPGSDATEAPAGFDTPAIVGAPGSKSTSNGIVEPANDSYALDQKAFENVRDATTGLGPVFNARAC